MTDIFAQAKAIIDQAATHPDPEAAMEALERMAGPEDLAMFAGLWEALVLKMNEEPVDDDDQA